jgi:hypothetical protein
MIMKYSTPQLRPAGVASALIQFKPQGNMDGTLALQPAALKALLEAE